jgi:hypothetical protein
MRCMAMRCMAMKYTPMRSTPTRCMAMGRMFMRCSDPGREGAFPGNRLPKNLGAKPPDRVPCYPKTA